MKPWGRPWARRGPAEPGQGRSAKRAEFQGRKYATKAEASYAERLYWEQQAGTIASWRPQPRIRVEIHGELAFTYVPDFEVIRNDGRVRLVEIKGWPEKDWIVRHRVFELVYLHEHPEVDYAILNTRFAPWVDPRPARRKKMRERARVPDQRSA